MNVRYQLTTASEDGVTYPFEAHSQISLGEQLAVDAHYHEYIEILYCTEGRYYIVLDGVGHNFEAGDMVIINSMEVHYVKSLNPGINHYIVIRFNPELLYTTTQTIF